MWKRRDEQTATVVDELVETYVAWREECSRLQTSYLRWRSAAPAERSLAFAAYVAALDGEDHAAAVYRGLIERAAAPIEHESRPTCSWVLDEDGLLQSW